MTTARTPQDRLTRRLQTAAREARAAELLARGWSQYQIANELNITQQAVSKMLHRMLNRYYAQVQSGLNRYIAQRDLSLAELEREAWAEYERSKTAATKSSVQRIGPAVATADEGAQPAQSAATIVKTKLDREAHFGDPRYLQIVLEAGKERNKIRGAYAPLKVQAVREPSPVEALSDEELLAQAQRDLEEIARIAQTRRIALPPHAGDHDVSADAVRDCDPSVYAGRGPDAVVDAEEV
jgi:predicted transcriptional regulator